MKKTTKLQEGVEPEFNLLFSFDDLNILGAEDIDCSKPEKKIVEDIVTLVHVKGELLHSDIDKGIEPVVLLIPENLLHFALNKWIEEKRGFMNRYNHYCGVSGGIQVLEYEEREQKINLLVEWKDNDDEGEPIYRDVRVFYVYQIEEYIDMEHG